MIMNSNHKDQKEHTGQDKIKPADNKSKSLVARISETIRFHQWIDRIDQKDKKLDPAKRKRKWSIILCASFLVYLLSFIVFPKPVLTHESIQPVSEVNPKLNKTLKNKKSLSFEMPVDSFENELKKQIHESIPEKK